MRRNSANTAQSKDARGARVNSPEARRDYIRRLVAAAPPITLEQAVELRRLLDAAKALEASPPPTAAAAAA